MNRNFIKMVFTLSFLFSIITMAYSQGEEILEGNNIEKMSPTAIAALKSKITDSMKMRLARIISLKEQGIIGEKNDGSLGFVRETNDSNDDAVVKEENSDRETAYKIVAHETNTDISTVADARAKQLADQAPIGYFIEKNGAWVQK